MSIANIFSIAGSGMTAQSIRMNTIASNIANAQTVARSEQDAYRAKFPVFVARNPSPSLSLKKAGADNNFAATFADKLQEEAASMGVHVSEIIESDAPIERRYQPDHPYADDEGYVYATNVNTIEEMADMISASRSYQMNVEIASTAKSMMQRLLTLGQ